MHDGTEDEDTAPKSAIEIAKGTASKRRGNAEALKKQTAGVSKSIDDPSLQRDIGILLLKYLKNNAFFDIAANVPILYYITKFSILADNLDIEAESYTWTFIICMNLVHLRLWYVRKVGEALSRIFSTL